ncbi:MAG: 3-isopropylmalate dehydratase large subunit [Candidatus Omnitrophica bacterium CG07_land_8_20_14_0_80_42_15]|uniref:3-isopropylmalate dehydratase large subunit n=1 Tax=Candidatus Aquitaenariimonas noxiae TaxID=1974741 RepID=A0A2J0KV44_9BACT|nr:MAG: 3-isopropylmalate dehydratase large subunit [Candidatus Omnitrophica bacterium CG07_land_8_20_14_0_80_42_15]
MNKTIAEKILSDHSGKNLKNGDIAICDVDFCFGQDGTSSIIIDSFEKLGVNKIFDKSKFCIVIDHNSPSPSIGTSTIHKKIRNFTKKYNAKLYDIGVGVCHELVPAMGHVTAGDLVLGADSHTCTYGAINVFSTGVGSTDLALTLATGKNWFKVPETIKVIASGKLPKGVYSKDMILNIIGNISAGGATYKSVEFSGGAISSLSVEARFTISNMTVEMGAKCGIMECDDKTSLWLKKHSKKKSRPVSSDKNANYCDVREYDVSKLEPQVARPHTVDNVCSVREIKGVKIDQAYLGTCTNGRMEDLVIAANILKNRSLHPGVRFIVAPASKMIYLEALSKGIIDLFVKKGAVVLAPGCGPCVGTGGGILGDGEVAISSANRNFKGRMGNPNAFIYLGSPATVTASAIEGKITDPRKYL